jgi:quinol-cytochrome oxidoreductase complex cytochrome b subunit
VAIGAHSSDEPVSIAGLWWGILIGPVAWSLDQGVSYAVDQHACSTGHFYLLHVVTVAAFVLALTGALVGWRQLRPVRNANEEGGSPVDRSWFMAWFGILMSTFFALTIIALAVPKIVLSPCD